MSTRNFLTLALAAIMSLAVGSTSFAASEYVAVVDMQKIVKESVAANDIREQIKKKRDSYQAEITKLEDELRDQDKKLAENRAILTPDAFEAEKKRFKERLTAVQKEVQVKRTKLDNALTKALGDVQTAVSDIIANLSKEHDFKVALPASQVLFASESLDISDEVIKKLNKKLPKVVVTIDDKADK